MSPGKRKSLLRGNAKASLQSSLCQILKEGCGGQNLDLLLYFPGASAAAGSSPDCGRSFSGFGEQCSALADLLTTETDARLSDRQASLIRLSKPKAL